MLEILNPFSSFLLRECLMSSVHTFSCAFKKIITQLTFPPIAHAAIVDTPAHSLPGGGMLEL